MWTTACPFHPERVQDFSDSGWEWSLEEPSRLYCPLCEEEGREYPYYPNPDYPDDGTGCYPSDEVWKRTHSPEWGEEHPGIPWDHWDGSPHGYSASGYAYFFRGKWHHVANRRMAKTVLPTLGEAWQICSQVLPDDDPRTADAEKYAHAAKIGLLTLARVHLGDAYLADIVGEGYEAMLAEAYEGDPRSFEGYVPYTLFDGITGSEEHPADSSNADIYCDGSTFGDAYADGWLRGFALMRDGYSEADEAAGMVRATQSLLAAHPDDPERLQAAGGEFELKYGKLDYHVRPYSMLGFHNLDGRLMASQFRLGRLLGDERVVRTTLDNYQHYLHNSIYGDGLSWEGSPAYTSCTWSTISNFIAACNGYSGPPASGYPQWLDDDGALDLYRARELCNSLSKSVLSCLPNGRQIAWEDSHAAARPPVSKLARCVRAGAQIPPDCRELFDVSGEPGAQDVQMRDPGGFPSYLLHNNRKMVFRMPRGDRTDLMALDYTWQVGHRHFPPMTLLWFTRGQEVLTDLGYLGAMHRLTKGWIKRCPSHNACIVRDEEGSHTLTHLLRGDPTGLMLDAGWLQVFEVAEQIPENLEALGEQGVYGRTVAQIACGDDASYLLDIMRVRGGARHEWYLHADGEALSVEGCAVEPVEAANLSEHWGLPGGSEKAWRHIEDVREGTTDGAWRAIWAPLRTWDSGEKQVFEDRSYRLTMLAGGPTEVVTGVAPGQRYTDNRDLNARLPMLCARRASSDEVDEFVAIHEAYEGGPGIESVERIDAGEGTVAVRVDRGEEVDYLVAQAWYGPRGPALVDTPDGQLACSDRFTAVTVADGEVTRACTIGGGIAGLEGFELEPGAGATGRLMAFDDNRDTLTIEPSSDWPLDGLLDGRWGMVRHDRGTSTFTIRDIERLEYGLVRINLKYTPHLVLNTVRATSVEDDNRIAVEPRPAHPWRTRVSEPNLLGFRVYRRVENGLEEVGTMAGQGSMGARDNYGKRLGPSLPTITVEGKPDLAQPGDDLLITRLRPGEDTVTVMPWGCFEAK